MSRTFFTKRPPASPNKPPPVPAKMPLKGQPVPIDVNLLVQGNFIERSEHVKKPRSAGIARITKLSDMADLDRIRPHTAYLDKHMLETLTKSPSVANSYYDRFERLDRDYVEGDVAYKEKGVRVKSATKPRSATPAPPRDRKRSKSASSHRRKKECFFDVAMSFDNETKTNTKTNSKIPISKGLLGIKGIKPRPESAKENRRRPRSGRKRRERSASRGRNIRSDSRSGRSVGSASWCSSRTSRSEQQTQGNARTRSSRSRTRRETDKNEPPDAPTRRGRNSTPGKERPASASHTKSRRKSSDRNGFLYRDTASASRKLERELVLLSQVLDATEPPMKSKQITRKTRTKRDMAIDAVKKANATEATLNQMKEIDRLMYKPARRTVTSSLPKLKMIVAPSATPLATLVRHSSAKMLMGNSAEAKRNI